MSDNKKSIPDYDDIKSPCPDLKEGDFHSYSANIFAGMEEEHSIKKTTEKELSANRNAKIKGIEKQIRDFGSDLLIRNGLDGYLVFVSVVTDGAGKNASESNKNDGARKAEWATRMKQAKEKLMNVDDPGIRQQLTLLSIDAQEVYHQLLDRSDEGRRIAVTADEITKSERMTMSKRSVENALQELRKAGLTTSAGSRKKPVIHLTESLTPSNASECLLYRATHSFKEKNRMLMICNQCTLNCPVHQS